MSRDKIVDEVREAREQYFKQFNFDLRALCDDLMEKQKHGKSPLVSPPPRPAQFIPKPPAPNDSTQSE